MAPAEKKEPSSVERREERSTVSLPRSTEAHVTTLRGPQAASMGRSFWRIAGAICLVLVAVAILVSFLSVRNDNARLERMRANGIPVTVTVLNCVGNIGGSGSNAAGYTCHGRYRLDGTTYHEIIGAMTTFWTSGSEVKGVVDPSQHSTVMQASALESRRTSPKSYLVDELLTAVFLALAVAFLRSTRRPSSSRVKQAA